MVNKTSLCGIRIKVEKVARLGIFLYVTDARDSGMTLKGVTTPLPTFVSHHEPPACRLASGADRYRTNCDYRHSMNYRYCAVYKYQSQLSQDRVQNHASGTILNLLGPCRSEGQVVSSLTHGFPPSASNNSQGSAYGIPTLLENQSIVSREPTPKQQAPKPTIASQEKTHSLYRPSSSN